MRYIVSSANNKALDFAVIYAREKGLAHDQSFDSYSTRRLILNWEISEI
jgi:hypothetical protein